MYEKQDKIKSVEEAQQVIDKVMNSMPQMQRHIEAVHMFASKYLYVETMQGNRRRLRELRGGTPGQKARALRQSYNAIVQGSGSYLTNNSLIQIRKWLYKGHYKSVLCNTVHDSVTIDVHPDEIEEVIPMAKHIMENLNLPILVNNDATGLKVPEKYRLPNNKYRFPFKAEAGWGYTYADDLEWDTDEYHKFASLKDYYAYSMQKNKLTDYCNTQMDSTNDEKVKEKWSKVLDYKLKELENKIK